MVGFWAVKPHAKDLNKFEDLMPLSIDELRNGRRKITRTIVRAQTPEEKAILDSIRNGGQQLLN